MKKIFAGILAAAVMVSVTACGNTTDTMNNWNYKTGLAAYARTGGAYGAASTDQTTTTMVAAVFDTNGKIVKINIDEVEARPGAAGEIISKKELGYDYGMKAASGIGKEWHEQIASLEKWLEGKDVSRLTSAVAGRMGEYMRADSRPSGAADEYTANSDAVPYGRNSNTANSAMDNSAVMDNSGNMMGDVMDGVNSMVDNITDGAENIVGEVTGMWADEDLRAMVTIDTSNIRTAIEKAWRNAK